MKLFLKVVFLSCAIFSVLCFKSFAQENTLDFFRDITVNGFASSSYNYNFDRPNNATNNIRVFDQDDNTFALDVAELAFEKSASDPGDIGFRLDLNYGYSIPESIHSTHHAAQGTGSTFSNDFDLQQAYVSYVAPAGTGVALDFGKFITHMGAEVIEGYDGWNYNYSRSILFGFAIPFTHTGLRASTQITDMVSVMGMIVNGWDVTTDNNDDKTYGVSVGITPNNLFSALLNYVGGPENTNNNSDWRHVFGAVLTIDPIENLTFLLNYNYGKGEKEALDGTDATWQGFSGIVRHRVSDALYINLRGEYFDDGDGARTGLTQRIWEVTVTPELIISNNFVLRPEYRHDDSNKAFFNGKNGQTEKSQDTIALNALFFF